MKMALRSENCELEVGEVAGVDEVGGVEEDGGVDEVAGVDEAAGVDEDMGAHYVGGFGASRGLLSSVDPLNTGTTTARVRDERKSGIRRL